MTCAFARIAPALPAVSLLAALLAGCGPDYSPNTYSATAVQQANKVEQGVIVGVRRIDIAAPGTTGAVAGAGGGAIVGSQASEGVGSALTALGGGVVGGILGQQVDRQINDTFGYEYIVRKAKNEMVSVTQKDAVPLAIGTHVLVIAGPQARIVVDYTVPLEPEKPATASVEPAPPSKPPAPALVEPAPTAKPPAPAPALLPAPEPSVAVAPSPAAPPPVVTVTPPIEASVDVKPLTAPPADAPTAPTVAPIAASTAAPTVPAPVPGGSALGDLPTAPSPAVTSAGAPPADAKPAEQAAVKAPLEIAPPPPSSAAPPAPSPDAAPAAPPAKDGGGM
ncbi:MAG TPA: hypothetical protein VMB81_07360 [Candidatus Sulfotelmatobacter sp.]|nr:hypothetical protein [Candidatus Sulfotelmatobacter sp.]